jgi:hypothetical protein
MKLGKVFRHHEERVWKTLSEGIGGELLHKDGWRNDKVVCDVEGHQVTLDLYTEVGYKSECLFTRFRTLVDNPGKLEFMVRHESLADRIAKWFGAHNVEIGEEAFDRTFRIRASDEPRARKIFSCPSIVARMKAEPGVQIHLAHAPSPERATNDWELAVMVEDEVNDAERLEQLFGLFADLLHETAHTFPR